MEYRILGKTGLKISRLGFGGIPIQRVDAFKTRELILKARENGINYIDTARAYTVSEEYLGYALEGVRQDFVLASKSYSRTKEEMARDIDISLKNLRTDYIDLYQIHNPSAAELEQVQQPGGALEALYEAKAQGKIGHIGVTLHSVELFEKAVAFDWAETIMFPYNIVETQGQALIRTCWERNIGFIAMKPLAGGAIDDAPLALGFIAQNQDVTVVIPGMATLEEMEQNIASTQNPVAVDEAALEKIRKELGTQFCRRCNYCAPCSAGIPISAVFLIEGYYSRYNLKDWAVARYEGLAHTAADCVGCGLCEERCPYNLPIRQMLKKAEGVFGK